MKCDNCNCIETYIKENENIYTIKGKRISVYSNRRFCKKCNNLVYDSELDNITSLLAIDLYNKQYGISKEKIIELRKKYNLSLELFSKIIGCAKKTLISYEKGISIPNDSYMIILKSLINKPDTILTLIESNKDNFSLKEYERINNKLSSFNSNNTKQLFCNEKFIPNEYNGYMKLSKEKIYNMILFFSNKTILKTKLLKEMFYADFLYYKDTCKSITGLEYYKLPFGPVPDQFDDILKNCILDNIINYEITFKNEYECHIISNKKVFNKNIFSSKELEILNKVYNTFSNYSSKEIVNISHKEKAFNNTSFNNKISYDYAFDINLL